MTFGYLGTLGVVAGSRDALVAILTAPSAELAAVGCLRYEVGVNEDDPNTVFVSELWTSAEAHRLSLELPSVQQAIAAARPLLDGRMAGQSYSVVGSPLVEGL